MSKKGSKQGSKDWEAFTRSARLALVAGGEDAKTRHDCTGCGPFMTESPEALKAALSECRECERFQTFHNICHYCLVLQNIEGV